ncbi:MAG: transglycosylase domain-containing protein [Pseudomonadales bacterium]
MAEFGERRLIPITLDQVPPLFVRALLDTEDKRFYEHSGVDLITLSTAALELVLNMGEISRGGSTITMQLPRNLGTFSLDQIFIRKFKEILLALKIERELSKDEILELYINAVPFGKRAYGAQAAALTYYGKPLAELNLAQIAMLAGIPQAPSAGNPINGPARALRRRNLVLSRMLEQKSITPEQYQEAVEAPITARVYQRELDVAAPYPAEWVRQQLLPRFPDLYSGGYEVITTLQADLQRAAVDAVRHGLLEYDRRHGYRGPEARLGEAERDAYLAALRDAPLVRDMPAAVVTAVADDHALALLDDGSEVRLDADAFGWARPYIDVDTRGQRPRGPADVVAVGDLIRLRQDPATDTSEARWQLTQVPEIQGALVSLDPQNGAIKALVGGFDFGVNQYNHALQAARQPGSGFKPFVYAAALQHGVTPASIYMDAPLVFEDQNLESEYRPDNDNNRYNGPTRLREALFRSINLVSMRVLLDVGAGEVLDYVGGLGFDTSSFPRNTQLAIGGGTMAVTPIDMARAYALFANGGWLIEPHVVDEVLDLSGESVYKARYPQICETCTDSAAPNQGVPRPIEAAADEAPGADEPGTLEALLAESDAQPAADPAAAAADVTDVDAPGGDAGASDADTTEAEPILLAPRVMDQRIAYIMNSMLQDVIRRGTGRRARSLERSDLAGKTGTTNDAADTWFNGYNRDLVTTVWVGFPNHDPLGSREYGSNTPLPIWIEYMKTALAGQDQKPMPQPAGVVTMRIDPATGQPAGPQQQDAIFEYFLAEHVPEVAPATRLEPADSEAEEVKPVDIF